MDITIKVDGVAYNVYIEAGGLKRGLEILDGQNAGRAKTSGKMIFDTIGTFLTYDFTFYRIGNDVESYDALVDIMSDPMSREHLVELPYGQSTVSFSAYFGPLSDALGSSEDGVNYWEGVSTKAISTAPYRLP